MVIKCIFTPTVHRKEHSELQRVFYPALLLRAIVKSTKPREEIRWVGGAGAGRAWLTASTASALDLQAGWSPLQGEQGREGLKSILLMGLL